MEVTLLEMPYTGSRNVPERSPVPDWLLADGLERRVQAAGAEATHVQEIALTNAQEREYGTWHRMGLSCGNLASAVSEHVQARRFVVGLLGNCTALLGMLGGLGRASGAAHRVGLLFLDAHGDFNTPETTLSGMLGGMPVAIAAGLCLDRLRRAAGLDRPLPAERIVLAGVRDLDAAERGLIEGNGVELLPVEHLRAGSPRLRDTLARLRDCCDAIYVHVDMDVLDVAEVAQHHTAVPGGPSSTVLAEALMEIFREEKSAVLGIASTPAGERDPEGRARRAAHRLIDAAVAARCETCARGDRVGFPVDDDRLHPQ